MSPENQFSFNKKDKTFKLLFYNNPNPMWIYDKKTLAFLDVNDTAEFIYGYSREEFLTMKISDIQTAEDMCERYQHLENTKEL